MIVLRYFIAVEDMTTYITPQFHSVTRDFLTCRRVRNPRLANEWRQQKAEAIRLLLPATFGSRHIWLAPDPCVVPGLPIGYFPRSEEVHSSVHPYGRPR